MTGPQASLPATLRSNVIRRLHKAQLLRSRAKDGECDWSAGILACHVAKQRHPIITSGAVATMASQGWRTRLERRHPCLPRCEATSTDSHLRRSCYSVDPATANATGAQASLPATSRSDLSRRRLERKTWPEPCPHPRLTFLPTQCSTTKRPILGSPA